MAPRPLQALNPCLAEAALLPQSEADSSSMVAVLVKKADVGACVANDATATVLRV
jgi:hypothetical protein